MDEQKLDKLYSIPELQIHESTYGQVTEKEKFHAAMLILLGLGILYIITFLGAIIRSDHYIELIDLCKTVFPSLAALILGAYFRDKQ